MTSRSILQAATRRRPCDSGSLSLMVAVLFIALVCLAGIVTDGGGKLNADENAAAVAEEAARSGATLADRSTAYATGNFVVSQGAAITAARAYLAAVPGVQGSVTADGNTAITVTVRITTPTRFLSLIGVDSMTSTATARAVLVSGGGG